MWVDGKAEEIWFNYFQKINKQVQYSDKIKLNQDSIVINCGVYSGNEIILFDGVKKIYNIDPFGKKFLDESASEVVNTSKTENIFVKSALYNFDENFQEQAQKNQEENVIIKNLSQIVEENKIDKISLIKSDIEGAERDMVEDLINLSEKFRPQLAISIYHKNRYVKDKLIDSVNIPMKLIKSLKNYNFYLEHYAYERQELILYCLPS